MFYLPPKWYQKQTTARGLGEKLCRIFKGLHQRPCHRSFKIRIYMPEKDLTKNLAKISQVVKILAKIFSRSLIHDLEQEF